MKFLAPVLVWADSPILDRELDESQSFPQRQVCRARVRTQALRRASDYNANRVSLALLQDIRARPSGYAADAEREQNVTVHWHIEIRR